MEKVSKIKCDGNSIVIYYTDGSTEAMRVSELTNNRIFLHRSGNRFNIRTDGNSWFAKSLDDPISLEIVHLAI